MIPSPPAPSFGERVRRQRRLLDLTQAELAKRAGCARVTIHKIESDDLRPSKQLAELLAQTLQIPSPEREAFVELARGAQWPEERRAPSAAQTRLLTNLPVQLTSFIGREREMAEVRRLLETTRLLTLTGSGGTGKTRLSLAVAGGVFDRFPDGVWLVELAPLADPAHIPQATATALGVPEQPGRPLLSTLTDHLRDKQLLLLLDNCEHVVEACAHFANTLLHAALGVKILASSREALGIAGETTYRVPSLSAPGPEAFAARAEPLRPTVPGGTQPSELLSYAAVRLFVERAAAAKSDFTLTNANALAVAQICYRLDGIPLAIELAAARVKAMRVEQIAERLDDRFRLLTGGSRMALPRQQTLRGTIDWSYSLLSEPERVLLRRLSVFSGGCTVEAVEAVCADQESQQPQPSSSSFCLPTREVFDFLTRLVDKSLIVLDEQTAEPRYRMLETIRQYARDKLLESGEAEPVKALHLKFYVVFAEQFVPDAFSPRVVWWLGRLELEIDNIRAGLEWSLEMHDTLSGLRLAGALRSFWQLRHPVEGLAYLDAVLSQPGAAVRQRPRADALRGQGFIHYWQGDYASAQASLEEALAIANEVGDAPLKSNLLLLLGVTRAALKDYVSARAYLTESLGMSHRTGDQVQPVMALCALADISLSEGFLDEAKALYEQSVQSLRLQSNIDSLSIPLRRLGQIALQRGEIDQAATYITESLTLNLEQGDRRGIAVTLAAMAALLVAQRPSLDALRLYGAVETLLESWQTQMLPIDQERYEETVATLHGQFDAATFDAAWAEGRALTLEQAIALAQRPTAAEPPAPNQTQAPALPADKSGLTVRESDVLRLLAEGLSNQQIAERLVVSTFTVRAHLRAIYGKLGVTTRSAATRYALEHHLL